MNEITVLTYNIHKGMSLLGTKFLLHEIKESIQKVNADILFLQEVQGENSQKQKKLKDWPRSSQFEFLADKIWPHFAYGKNAIYDHGHHGNAILSKYPIIFSENIDVSTNRFEKRGILHAELKINNEMNLHVMNGHYNLLPKGRQIQIVNLCKRASSHVPQGAPLIMAGDFNDWGPKLYHLLEQSLGAKEVFLELFGECPKTFPAPWPLLSLDRIFYKHLRPESAQVLKGPPWNELSDHLALMATFSFS